MTDHSEVTGIGPGTGFWLLSLLLLAGAGYACGVGRLRRRGDQWSRGRSAAAAGGLLTVATAVVVGSTPGPAFPIHVVQHLLTTMLGALLLALSAPITLALRTVPRAARQLLLTAMHSPLAVVLATAPVVLILNIGGLYGYYLTPLYGIAHQHPVLQALLHLHMFLAGCLLSWYLVGPDPMVRRPAISTALVVLLVTAAAHDILAKLLYARELPTGAGASNDIQLGAQIMYYGGTVVELLLATALMIQWYTRGGRALRHEHRRARGRANNAPGL